MPLIDRTDLQSRRGPGFRTRIVAELGLDLDKFAVKPSHPNVHVRELHVAEQLSCLCAQLCIHAAATASRRLKCIAIHSDTQDP